MTADRTEGIRIKSGHTDPKFSIDRCSEKLGKSAREKVRGKKHACRNKNRISKWKSAEVCCEYKMSPVQFQLLLLPVEKI